MADLAFDQQGLKEFKQGLHYLMESAKDIPAKQRNRALRTYTTEAQRLKSIEDSDPSIMFDPATYARIKEIRDSFIGALFPIAHQFTQAIMAKHNDHTQDAQYKQAADQFRKTCARSITQSLQKRGVIFVPQGNTLGRVNEIYPGYKSITNHFKLLYT